jgi:hypothetical protein
MKYLYYNCLKDYVDFKVDLPLDVAEFIGRNLRKKIAEGAGEEEVNKVYDEMEKTCALCFFLMDQGMERELRIMYLDKEDEKFKKHFVESFSTCSISNIKNESIIFVKPNFLDMFLKYIFPKIKKRIYLYTGASDYSIDEKYMKYVKNSRIIKWLGHNIVLQHDKIVKIPIGFSNICVFREELLDKLSERKLNICDKECKLFISYMEETNSKRKNLVEGFENKNWVVIGKKCAFETYMEKLNKYRFILCPRGNGLDTYRFWETVFMGSIPIVESSNLDDLYSTVNCIIVNSFNDINEELLKSFSVNESLLKNNNLKICKYINRTKKE